MTTVEADQVARDFQALRNEVEIAEKYILVCKLEMSLASLNEVAHLVGKIGKKIAQHRDKKNAQMRAVRESKSAAAAAAGQMSEKNDQQKGAAL